MRKEDDIAGDSTAPETKVSPPYSAFDDTFRPLKFFLSSLFYMPVNTIKRVLQNDREPGDKTRVMPNRSAERPKKTRSRIKILLPVLVLLGCIFAIMHFLQITPIRVASNGVKLINADGLSKDQIDRIGQEVNSGRP